MIKRLFILCISVLLFSSCDDFLAEKPKNSLPAASFFESKTLCEASVNYLYRQGWNSWASPGVYDGSRLMVGGYSAGLFDNLNYKGQEMFITYAQEFGMTPNNVNTKMNDLWRLHYIPLSRANTVINVMPEVNAVKAGITEEERTRYITEARFFRAQYYFYLVKHFGDVPLLLEAQDASDNLNVPRENSKKIYDEVIIPDLLEAIKTLPKKAQYGNNMRITAPVASAHLIDVYVQMAGFPVNDNSKWAAAAAEAKKFLPGGEYEKANLHSLVKNENFEELSAYNLFRSVNVNDISPGGRKLSSCPEFIYVTEYMVGISSAGFSSNAWPMEVAALGTSECRVSLTNNAYKPMPRYLAMYDDKVDLRMKERQYFANYFDKRDGSPMYNSELNTPSPYFYYDYGAVKGAASTSGRHFALYRLAEMYLFAAEAIAQSEGVTEQAIDALATIRARAYEYGDVKKEDIVASLTGLSKEKFIEEVWLERYREFVFEFKDWNLIQRTRKYPKTHAMDSSIPKGTAQFVDITTVGTDFSKGKNFSVDNLLWPISLTQMQLNNQLVQNPGYPAQ